MKERMRCIAARSDWKFQRDLLCLFHETKGENELSRDIGSPQQKYHLGCFKCNIKELKQNNLISI